MLYQYGLVLSGGGTRGIAHIGVLKALEEAGIEPKIVAGSSAGAIVGVLFAAGLEADDIFSLIRNKSLYSIVKMGLPNKGMMELSYFKEVLQKHLPGDTFEQLDLPFYVAVTNLNKGGCEIVHQGNKLVDHVIASASIPMVFKPVEIDGHLYVDGGVINNLPVEPLRDKCQVLIGVNVNTVEYIDQVNGIRDVGVRCLDISLQERVQNRLKRCDIAVEPLVSRFGIFDLSRADDIYQAGYEAAKSAIFAYQAKGNPHGSATTR